MPEKPESEPANLDEVDRRILGILSENPRLPYSDISDRLAKEGFDLSGEAIRQRVSALFEITSNFFLVRPKSHNWELVLVTVQTSNEPDAKQNVFDAMSDMRYWYVGSGFGTIDLYGFATVESTSKIESLLDRTRTQSGVSTVDYFIETEHSAAVEKYLQISEE